MLKVRLFYKIFMVVLLSVVFSVGIVALVIGYFGYKNFNTYLVKSRLEELDWLTVKLGDYYKEHGGFDDIAKIKPDFSKKPFFPPHDNRPEGGMPDNRRPEPFMGGDGFRPERVRPENFQHIQKIFRVIFLDEKGNLNPEGFAYVAPFINLLDSERRVITGFMRDETEFEVKEIKADGIVVGYLGMIKPPNIEHPLALAYMKQMGSQMVFSSLLIIFFSGVLTWVLTKRLLMPVVDLTKATKKLAARDFDFSLNNASGDEIGDLAENFRQMADDLRKYEQNQNRWISDISHELRTPLSVMLGSIEAMQDGVRRMDERELSVLHEEVRRIICLVNDLHEMTMAESGNMRFDMKPVSIGDVLNTILDFYAVRAEEFGFRIDAVTRGCSARVIGDVSRLRQVFINLLENALKHAKSPGSILAGCVERDGFAVISLEDSGPGVADEHLGMLFDRLYRADSSRNRKTGGSGLGLAICRYIVEKHNGSITAMHGSMGGLRIEIAIPLENYDE